MAGASAPAIDVGAAQRFGGALDLRVGVEVALPALTVDTAVLWASVITAVRRASAIWSSTTSPSSADPGTDT